ncbi:MAG: SurA N-terminal domain-containing protein, partial [Nitrospirae bacterium]|nr:SurA N-terminal domain-containing protein [Nitrospirota bacterium]
MKKLSILTIGLVSLLAFSAFAEELANVNGVSITTDDYQKALASVPPQSKAQLANPDEKKRFVNILVDREILTQEAKKAGMDKDPVFLDEVEQAKKEILVNMMAQKLNK